MKTNDTKKNGTNAFESFASNAAKATGSPYGFSVAFLIVVAWAICGPIFDFSETWQLVINTGTTIITFLMVFLIQKAQNKDSLAIQLKLNELVASSEYSSNRLVDIENMTENEMMIVQKYYRSLSELSKKDVSLKASHSIEEAEEQHQAKTKKIHKDNPESKIAHKRKPKSQPSNSKTAKTTTKTTTKTK